VTRQEEEEEEGGQQHLHLAKVRVHAQNAHPLVVLVDSHLSLHDDEHIGARLSCAVANATRSVLTQAAVMSELSGASSACPPPLPSRNTVAPGRDVQHRGLSCVCHAPQRSPPPARAPTFRGDVGRAHIRVQRAAGLALLLQLVVRRKLQHPELGADHALGAIVEVCEKGDFVEHAILCTPQYVLQAGRGERARHTAHVSGRATVTTPSGRDEHRSSKPIRATPEVVGCCCSAVGSSRRSRRRSSTWALAGGADHCALTCTIP
jgi:hypothetical protein